jgi:ribA/ribD-fused uncharacterized protein
VVDATIGLRQGQEGILKMTRLHRAAGIGLVAIASLAFLAPARGEAAAPPAKKDPWDARFEGVVHDEQRVCGFVEGYRWLSNFWPCRVEWEGRAYGSSEAAYQAAKFPPAERGAFTTLEPDAAKKLAHAKPLPDAAAWDARKERVMREIVWAKFSQHPDLATKLRATGTRYLEETNSWGDEIWGVYHGQGQNLLGKILMETRARLARESDGGKAKRPQ